MKSFRIYNRTYVPKYSLGLDIDNRWRIEKFNEQTLSYEWMSVSFDSKTIAQNYLNALLEEYGHQCISMQEVVQIGKWKKISECNLNELNEIKPLIGCRLLLCDTEKSVVGYSANKDIWAIILVKKSSLREYLLSIQKDVIFPDYLDADDTYEIVGYYEKCDYGIDLFNAADMLEDRIIPNDPIMWVSRDQKFFGRESLYHLGFYPYQTDEVIIKQLD